jgi:signal transduction histidine kinase
MDTRGLAQRLPVAPVDIVLVLCLLVLGYWNLWWDWDNYFPEQAPHLVIDSVTVAVAVLALLARRRAPVAVLFIVNAALYGPDLFVPTGPVFWGEWVPAIVAAYSVGAYRGGRYVALPVVASLGSVTVFAWRYPAAFLNVAGGVTWVAPVVIAAAAGQLIGRLRSSSTQLAERADVLERSQTRRAERAVADERARIARELHDVIAHNVSIMVVQASAAENTLERDAAAARRALQNVQAAGREALDEMRLLLGVLRDDGQAGLRTPVPSLRRLDVLIDPLRDAGMDVTVAVTGDEHRIPPSVDVSAYRVVQEALTNSLKHAVGSKVDVAVDIEPAGVRVEIRDRGGVRGEANGGGLGLIGLRERVALLGGSIQAGPNADGGFTVTALLPTDVGVAS